MCFFITRMIFWRVLCIIRPFVRAMVGIREHIRRFRRQTGIPSTSRAMQTARGNVHTWRRRQLHVLDPSNYWANSVKGCSHLTKPAQFFFVLVGFAEPRNWVMCEIESSNKKKKQNKYAHVKQQKKTHRSESPEKYLHINLNEIKIT